VKPIIAITAKMEENRNDHVMESFLYFE